jgi:PAS domain S-box-containing protein
MKGREDAPRIKESSRELRVQLAAVSRQLASSQRLAKMVSWSWNFVSDTVTWTGEVERIFGADSDAIDSMPEGLINRIHPDDQDRVREAIRRVVEDSATLDEQFRVLKEDGSTVVLRSKAELDHANGFSGCMIGTLQDVSQLKEAQVAFTESDARFRAILETTVDGIVTIDERGIIESFNPAAERIFGYAAAEVIGQNVGILMPPEYREQHDTYLQSYLDTGRGKIIGIGREVPGQRKNGTVFPMDLAVSEVKLLRRRLFTGIVRDVQERQRIGQDLHDGLGQMLTGIGLIAQSHARRLRDRDLDESVDAEEITELIREADEYARSLARGLIPVELDAHGLSSAFRRLAKSAAKLFGVRCVYEESGQMPALDNVLATHLYRIAQEGLSNAVRHGRATRVRIVMAYGREQLRLRVIDDGDGFPEGMPIGHPGMGVRIMHHRARIIGATLEIRAGASGGTVVTCSMPRRMVERN